MNDVVDMTTAVPVPAPAPAPTGTLPMFPFPFRPYASQLELMTSVYDCISSGPTADDDAPDRCAAVGLFESPTGTGKSLSLIVAALHWMESHNAQSQSTTLSGGGHRVSADPSWVGAFVASERAEQVRSAEAEFAKRRQRVLQIEQNRSTAAAKRKAPIKETISATATAVDGDDDADLLIEWQESANDVIEYDETTDLLPDDAASNESPAPHQARVLYCSRTHSQLAQFTHEISKTVFADRVRVVSLGSRQQLCTHPAVRALRTNARMNDACVDMSKSNSRATKRNKHSLGGPCAYYSAQSTRTYVDYVHARIRDIEELSALGNKLSACAYYGTRAAMKNCHVITMPYSLLCHQPARISMGIQSACEPKKSLLHDSIIILDEAHNLVETINALHSATITLATLTAAQSSLQQYHERYQHRLHHTNHVLIKQLMFVLQSFTAIITNETASTADTDRHHSAFNTQSPSTQVFRMNAFVIACSIGHLNLFRLHSFIVQSELAHKLNGFIERFHGLVQSNDSDEHDESQFVGNNISALSYVTTFLNALNYSNDDGRVIVERVVQSGRQSLHTSRLRFIMLNPAAHMTDIVKHARAILLVGGTLQPFNYFTQQLFSHVPPKHIRCHSYGHVIPDDHVCSVALSSGPSDHIFDFRHQTRHDQNQLDELARLVLNVSAIVPDGIIIFLPSYATESALVAQWQQSGLWEKITAKKRIFREGRHATDDRRESESGRSESVLRQYTEHIRSNAADRGRSGGGGGVLVCVVGGKLSEGINFTDELCRCVIVVGLPYANAQSCQLKETMAYLTQHSSRGVDTPSSDAGAEYYENLCMRAVNQCLGRAIRHVSDFAAMILCDVRYERTTIQSALPQWIRNALTTHKHKHFGTAFVRLAKFFHKHKQTLKTNKQQSES